ncbi:hypothetical protein ACQ4PT_061610 [Festuca glaucescens]
MSILFLRYLMTNPQLRPHCHHLHHLYHVHPILSFKVRRFKAHRMWQLIEASQIIYEMFKISTLILFQTIEATWILVWFRFSLWCPILLDVQGIQIKYFRLHRCLHHLLHHPSHNSILLDPMAIFLAPQYRTMEITFTIHHQHHCLIMHTICSHHHRVHQVLRISSHICHPNPNKEHNLGIVILPILRDISTMDMTEDPIHSTGDITLMIDGITLTIEGGVSMMEGIILMLEDITSMMDHITMMIEGITSMEDKCILKLWIEEGFLHILDQIPRIQTILTMGDPWTIRQVHAPGGQCRLGDQSILLAPDIQWILRFPMKEVGGGMEDTTIMIDFIDDWAEALCLDTQNHAEPHLRITVMD